MAIYMKYEGVPGEVTVKGFEKFIEVESFQFGIGRHISSARGTSTREGGDASISEVVVTRQTDGATVKFFEEAVTGKLNKVVEIKFARTGAGESQEYLGFKLEGCGIAGLSFSASGGQDSRPSESMHMNFDKITCKYNPIGDDFTGSPATYGWDLAKASKL